MTIMGVALSVCMAGVPTELGDYLALSDRSYRWEKAAPSGGATLLSLTSQTWHGKPWRHTVSLSAPKRTTFAGTAILVVTGGKVNQSDLALAQLGAEASGMPVATLFDIPNQPLFEMREDDLIAHTFERFLESGDATWPLLFPMAKSVLRAMDAIQDATKATSNPIQRFIVTGASKRGWTTWLVGASGDRRIVGIAPMVIDNLNLAAQMRHQMQSWGHYSEMIQDYTRRDLQAQLGSERGQRLAAIVDPYSYRDRVKAPTLIVNGANDAYWTTDALSLYWDGLKQSKSVLYVPNAGHGLGDGALALSTVAAFARSCAGEFKWPSVSWGYKSGRLVVTGHGLTPVSCKLWVASSKDLDFQASLWKVQQTAKLVGKKATFSVPPATENRAIFAEVQYSIKGRSFSICTRTWVERPAPQGRAPGL